MGSRRHLPTRVRNAPSPGTLPRKAARWSTAFARKGAELAGAMPTTPNGNASFALPSSPATTPPTNTLPHRPFPCRIPAVSAGSCTTHRTLSTEAASRDGRARTRRALKGSRQISLFVTKDKRATALEERYDVARDARADRSNPTGSSAAIVQWLAYPPARSLAVLGVVDETRSDDRLPPRENRRGQSRSHR
jgi:hypothetical protein